MNRTSADGGVNLVIFDADADFEDRKKKLILWKERCHVDFELFLFPNNKDTGELEDLLEKDNQSRKSTCHGLLDQL